jgi:tetratricopeptide (TPR) repeat protein
MNERLLTAEQATQLLYVSNQKMDEWIRNGEIRSQKSDDGLTRVWESEIVNAEAQSCFQRGCELAGGPHSVDEAAWYFNKAISANPRFNLAYFELGRMYYTWGRYYEAQEPLRKSVELNPCFPAYMNYACNCFQWGHYHDAEQLFRNALQIVPDHAQATYELAFCIMITSFYQPDRLREAIKYYRKTLELRPEHEMAAWFLGETLVLHLQAFDEARAFIQEIQGRFPHTAQHIHLIIEINEPTRLFSFVR